MKVHELKEDEFAEFYANYVRQVPDITLRSAMEESAAQLTEYLTELPESHHDHAYAEGKWTVKECLQHIIDTERIFSSRALRLGRHDSSPLPGFDQDDYANRANVSQRDFGEMIEEFRVLRKATIALYKGFTEEDLKFRALVSDSTMSCRAMGFVICGHVYHHVALYRERYGNGSI